MRTASRNARRVAGWSAVTLLLTAAPAGVGHAATARPGTMPPGTAQPQTSPPGTVRWQTCRDVAPAWKADDARSQCAQVQVPFDHADPGGRQIGVAISRIPATDPARRRGVLLLNPGGPGAHGTTMPAKLLGTRVAGLNTQWDLIGFDPRGLGFSDRMSCDHRPEDDAPPPEQIRGDAKEELRHEFTRKSAEYGRCARTDLAFTATMNTETIARDMDAIRAALGEEKIGFYGVSWGTALGARYRTLFDDRVDRMLLESVMPPALDLTAIERGQAHAAERGADRFAAWVAERDATLRLGRTGQQVRQAAQTLRAELARSPRRDGDRVFDEGTVLAYLRSDHQQWPVAARALSDLVHGRTPAANTAATPPPAAASAGFGFDVKKPGAQGMFGRHAINCNDSGSTRDFDQAWRHHLALRAQYPVGGERLTYDGSCLGWPLPPRVFDAGPGRSTLLLVGHRHESNTPLEWTYAMQAVTGGDVLVVADDEHGSLSRVGCADRAVAFFSGDRVTGECTDVPAVPDL